MTDEKAKRYEHITYFPFGETWVQEANATWRVPYQFTSKEMDQETGLYYFGARYYDPRTSVWQSADPILNKYLPTGNKEKDAKLPGYGGINNSINLGLYSYSHQNPIKLIDPDGNAVFDNAAQLTAAGNAVLADPSVQPGVNGGKTWCNRGVALIEERGGGDTSSYGNGVAGQYKLANKMISENFTNPKFATVITAEQAVAYAMQGVTIVAARPEAKGHAHVTIVAPVPMVNTGSGMVPTVFNVGPKKYFGKRTANWAFGNYRKNPPKFYIRNDDIATLNRRKASQAQNDAK